jgi:hypothetical protein
MWYWQKEVEILGKRTCPSAILSIINIIWLARDRIRATAVTGLTAWAMGQPLKPEIRVHLTITFSSYLTDNKHPPTYKNSLVTSV